jgi:hypothetical protein
MDKIVIDEIKSDRVEKFEKLFRNLAVITTFLAMARLALRPEILTGNGSTIDYLISLSPILFYASYKSKASKNTGQFIKWTETSIKYKTKDTHGDIVISDIKSIEINLDIINIVLKDASNHSINIEDFTKYEDRVRIKGNFEKVKNYA